MDNSGVKGIASGALASDVAQDSNSEIKNLTMHQYQALAVTTDRNADSPFAFHLLGLFGEAGSLLSVAKKKQRDKVSYVGYVSALRAADGHDIGPLLAFART